MNISVVIPCYRVRREVCTVVNAVLALPQVRTVIVVDDACPDRSGDSVSEAFELDPRVKVIRHAENHGVGGATLTGYAHAFDQGADVAVKIDGDGQMRADLIPALLTPILRGEADYAKGNRFFRPRDLVRMPGVRLFGNAILALVSKFCSGYWSVMDPTNGFTALHRVAYRNLELEKLARDYFFEADLLYQLGIIRAVVVDVPMPVIYGDERSSLSIGKVMMRFPGRFLVRFLKRLSYQYFIREFNAASLEIFTGVPLFLLGVVLGGYYWVVNAAQHRETPTGMIVIVAVLILIGFQLILSALNYDIAHEPRLPLQFRLSHTDEVFMADRSIRVQTPPPTSSAAPDQPGPAS